MSTNVIVFSLFVIFVAADVVHLSRRYLPPNVKTAGEQQADNTDADAIAIEQQELQELPEQIDYIGQDMNSTVREQLSAEVETTIGNVISAPTPQSAEYLAAPAEELITVTMSLPPAEAAPRAMATEEARLYPMPTRQYLPPPLIEIQMSQPNYQQYQEQLLQSAQQTQKHTPVSSKLEAEPALTIVAPAAPTVAVGATANTEPVPVPAHILASDGYHYKTGHSHGLDERIILDH